MIKNLKRDIQREISKERQLKKTCRKRDIEIVTEMETTKESLGQRVNSNQKRGDSYRKRPIEGEMSKNRRRKREESCGKKAIKTSRKQVNEKESTKDRRETEKTTLKERRKPLNENH